MKEREREATHPIEIYFIIMWRREQTSEWEREFIIILQSFYQFIIHFMCLCVQCMHNEFWNRARFAE